MELAWEAGIRFYDTAPLYGFGLAERRLGSFLRTKPRADYVLATKVGRLLDPVPGETATAHGFVEASPFEVRFDYSHDAVLRSVEASIERMGIDRFDILFAHDIGTLTHGPTIGPRHFEDLATGGIPALQRLKAEGTIAGYGIGVNEVEVCLDLLARVPLDVILLAGRYTLLDRTSVPALLPLCRERGTAIVIGGAFNSGILATGARPGATFNYAPAEADILARVEALEGTALAHGLALPAAALAFPLGEPLVGSVLIGTASPAELRRNLDLLGTQIPESARAAFDRIALAP